MASDQTTAHECTLADRKRQAALRRDAADRGRLIDIDTKLAECLDAVAPQAAPLLHPYRRWSPGDLIDDLKAHRAAIKREKARLNGPLVIEDEETPP